MMIWILSRHGIMNSNQEHMFRGSTTASGAQERARDNSSTAWRQNIDVGEPWLTVTFHKAMFRFTVFFLAIHPWIGWWENWNRKAPYFMDFNGKIGLVFPVKIFPTKPIHWPYSHGFHPKNRWLAKWIITLGDALAEYPLDPRQIPVNHGSHWKERLWAWILKIASGKLT